MIRTWEDHLKPGESAPGGPWCASRGVDGHVKQIVTGCWSKEEAIATVGGRSAYLDDLEVHPGDRVICKADINGSGFTPGRTYEVLPGSTLIDDHGHRVIPSARFWRAG